MFMSYLLHMFHTKVLSNDSKGPYLLYSFIDRRDAFGKRHSFQQYHDEHGQCHDDLGSRRVKKSIYRTRTVNLQNLDYRIVYCVILILCLCSVFCKTSYYPYVFCLFSIFLYFCYHAAKQMW